MNTSRPIQRSWACQIAATIAAIALALSEARAEQPQVKIVGIGATSCAEFLNQARETPAVQRDDLAWAQGFMSVILLSRPTGVDERLDLLPPALPCWSNCVFT